MLSKEKTKQYLELGSRNLVIPREPTIFDSLDAGEDIVTKMIEDGLDALGQNVGRVILHHIEVSYSLKRNPIPWKIDVFTKALRDMFGEGSHTIERIIVETISRKMGISIHETKTRTLPEIVGYIRRRSQYVTSEP
nr:hypothetical protein [Candidatus Njordarchaeum guaymaensis]